MGRLRLSAILPPFYFMDNIAKPFALFTGANYYPEGGFHDYDESFATEAEAQAKVATYQVDWWHIVDLRACEIVSAGHVNH